MNISVNLRNRKVLYTALLSTLALTALFFAIPTLYAAPPPYITVTPTAASPSSIILVKGYNFPKDHTIQVYLDRLDSEHLLGKLIVPYTGRFELAFKISVLSIIVTPEALSTILPLSASLITLGAARTSARRRKTKS